jgi:hypothetical protein
MTDEKTYTRRRLLQGGAATAGGVVLGSLSGCGSILGGGSGGPQLIEWVAPPDQFGLSTARFNLIDFDQIRANEQHFDETVYADLKSGFTEEVTGRFGLDDWTSVSAFAGVAGGTVYTGSFDASTVVEANLERENGLNWVEETSYQGYTVLVPEDSGSGGTGKPEQALGVAEGEIVTSLARSGLDDTIETYAVSGLETIIDTKQGRATRLTDANEQFGTLATELGTGTLVRASTTADDVGSQPDLGQFAGMAASGTRYSIEGTETDAKFVTVFDDPTTAEDANLSSYASELESQQVAWSSTSVQRDGQVATITGTLPTDRFGA